MKQYSLSDLEAFKAVVETGGFHSAADSLNSSSAAISRRVSSLEKKLGARLLNRTTRSVNLTEAGENYFQYVLKIFDVVEASEDNLLEEKTDIQGTLRVAAPMGFGLRQITPLIPDFLERHPGIVLDIQFDDRMIDIHSERIDVAFRIGNLEDSTLVATKLAPVETVICTSPEYLKKYGTPTTPVDLKNHNCLTYSLVNNSNEWPVGQNKSYKVSGQMTTNNGEALLQAAVQGVGIVYLPLFIVKEDLDNGNLIRILDNYKTRSENLYAVRPSRQFTPAKVELIIEYLKQSLKPSV